MSHPTAAAVDQANSHPLHQTTDTRSASAAATKIQARTTPARTIRLLYRTISAVDAESGEIDRRIQRQETVDAVRREEREKARVNEELMRLLLRLDAIPGFDPAVREARRKSEQADCRDSGGAQRDLRVESRGLGLGRRWRLGILLGSDGGGDGGAECVGR
ncbi:unnamed protein product [Linum tenue]|uniref:BAG domain-containing protein n=1 Tax=Linum tenue TaxID=586396 RepID=A0AAV0Q3Y8_9ROSI|nr:unnamed protein product [Linum tenue]